MTQLIVNSLTLLGTALVVVMGLTAIQHMNPKTNHITRLCYCIATTAAFCFVVGFALGHFHSEPLYLLLTACTIMAMLINGRCGITLKHLRFH